MTIKYQIIKRQFKIGDRVDFITVGNMTRTLNNLDLHEMEQELKEEFLKHEFSINSGYWLYNEKYPCYTIHSDTSIFAGLFIPEECLKLYYEDKSGE